jgi:hypothetical protein
MAEAPTDMGEASYQRIPPRAGVAAGDMVCFYGKNKDEMLRTAIDECLHSSGFTDRVYDAKAVAAQVIHAAAPNCGRIRCFWTLVR